MLYTHKKQILIIEDDAHRNWQYTEQIKPLGFKTTSVFSIQDATRLLKHRAIDGIVMNLSVVANNGHDILDELIRRPDLSHIKLICVSGTLYVPERHIMLDRVNYALINPKPHDVAIAVKNLWP